MHNSNGNTYGMDKKGHIAYFAVTPFQTLQDGLSERYVIRGGLDHLQLVGIQPNSVWDSAYSMDDNVVLGDDFFDLLVLVMRPNNDLHSKL